MEKPEKFGVLGSWKKFDESFDASITKQSGDASCVAAVGEMLAQYYGVKATQNEKNRTFPGFERIRFKEKTVMTKFLNAKLIGDEKFEIVFLQNDKELKFTVTRRRVFIDSTNECMTYFVAEEPAFYKVWGVSLTLRKKVTREINRIITNQVSTLQSA